MPKVATEIDYKELRKEMLEYFWTPKRSKGIEVQPAFINYPQQAVKRMLYALDWAGLIRKIFGGTQGSQYQTTMEGRSMLEIMRERERQ